MSDEDLSIETTVQISLGHLLMIWDLMEKKLAGAPLNEAFTAEEKRAIWALEDLFEKALVSNGITGRHQLEW